MNLKKYVVYWLVLLLCSLATTNIHAANIIENGTFDEGYFPWDAPGWWAGGAGDSAVDERGRFCTTVTALGTADWGAQLRQSQLAFVSGENYQVSLRAWSSVPVTMQMSATDESAGFVWIFGGDITIDSPLGGDGQVITVSFNAGADSDSGHFRFLLGGGNVPVGETVCFDDIVVDAPSADINLIENGTFDSGFEPWALGEFGGAATPFLDEGRGCVLVDDPGAESWSLQVRVNGLDYVENGEYLFRADAWSSAPVNIQVAGVDESAGFVWHFGQDVAIDAPLDAEPQKLSVDFVNGGGVTENGIFRFLLGNGHVEAGTTICFDNIELLAPSNSEIEEPVEPAVYVNAHGYLTAFDKYAVYVALEEYGDVTSPRAWSLFSGETSVASGETIYRGLDEGSGDHVHGINFGHIQTEADNYTLVVTEGDNRYTSQPFAIRDDLYATLKYDALSYFYHNRANTPILADVVGDIWARPAGHVSDSAVQTIECQTDSSDPACRTLDSSGGWYDAGDHGKYVVNGGISVWTLLNQYERAQVLGSDAGEFADGAMTLPAEENGNGTPDILDEARWEIEWFLTMQIPADYPLAGMVHHKMHSEYWTGLPTAPHEDDVSRYVHPPSTTATLNFAAVTAQCYRVYKALDANFANGCLQAAEVAYAAAKANDFIPATSNGNGGGTYGDNNASDEFYWAASELYLSTGKQAYAQDMQASVHHLSLEDVQYGQAAMGWGTTQALGLLSLATVGPQYNADESWVAQARNAVISVAELYVGHTEFQAYGLPMWTGGMYWGSNSNVTNDMIMLGLAHDFSCDERYLETMHTNMHYLLGNNPLGVSYVSGYGENDMKEPHHRFWANVVNSDFPPVPAGVIAGGPNSLLQDPIAQSALQGCDPLKCYIDHWESYSTNEVTINWNAPLAWTAAYMDQWSDASLKAAAQSRCAIRNQHFSSFEDDTRSWSKHGAGEISVVEGGTRGDNALEVDGCGYTYLDTPQFSTTEFEVLGDSLAIDVMLPDAQDNPHWLGNISFHITLPSAGIHNQWIDMVPLTDDSLGSWFTAKVALPASIKAALAEEHEGLISVALNTSNCSAPLLVDNLRFTGNTHAR
ncbi:glycoside hydrolase family 9 protein [Teredinibacter franksiae]|uniref:glycoside hydrolase family 9 protein n=1 Tax=Teredinibacter franksiae TaxID=2761453 RepID=UPI0016283CC0|nr:glycoside hydrolase family 9 protein [Teredinibacter franksiae]